MSELRVYFEIREELAGTASFLSAGGARAALVLLAPGRARCLGGSSGPKARCPGTAQALSGSVGCCGVVKGTAGPWGAGGEKPQGCFPACYSRTV